MYALLTSWLTLALLPFTQFQLDNGLTVIVHEEHAAPLVAVDVWYHVGSRNEPAGKTGFAHLFEHLMFQGSRHVGDDQHFRYVTEAGGSVNGTTNRDRTNYFEHVPSSYTERMLFLEADRMGTLLDAISQKKLDNQRDVVKNERRQNYENRPYGLAYKILCEAIFPKGHPYHHMTIGEHVDLEAASLDDVRAFFRTYYAPNNATLVVAGDVDPAQVRAWTEKYFGKIPRGPALQQARAPQVPKLATEVRAEVSDRVSLERLYLVWPSSAMHQAGDAELDILEGILGGKAGRLYKRLVHDTQMAQWVSASQSSGLLASTFEITVAMKPGRRADEAIAIVDEELARIRKEDVKDSELERVRAQLETGVFEGLMSVGGMSGRADLLARYHFYTGNPGYLDEDLARHRAVTAASLRAQAIATLKPERLVLKVVPKVAVKAEAK